MKLFAFEDATEFPEASIVSPRRHQICLVLVFEDTRSVCLRRFRTLDSTVPPAHLATSRVQMHQPNIAHFYALHAGLSARSANMRKGTWEWQHSGIFLRLFQEPQRSQRTKLSVRANPAGKTRTNYRRLSS